MKVESNHKSIVVIGGFNPTILSPDFLRDNCGFKWSQEPKGQITPVVTEFYFGNIKFTCELNRFQILLKDNQILTIFTPLI